VPQLRARRFQNPSHRQPLGVGGKHKKTIYMGRMKDLLIQRMDETDEEQLAHKLGITHEELVQLNHTIDTEESEDGVIYNYIVSFDPNSPEEILDKVKGLQGAYTLYMSPWEFEGDYYYEEQYQAITSNKHYYESFLQAMDSAVILNDYEIDEGILTLTLKRQIYVSIMSALEAFLSETFINLTIDNPDYFRNFIESYPDFKERRIELSRIFSEQERIKETAKKVMVEVIYHNLAKVSKMYGSTFNIEFPDISEMARRVHIRHDLVHRNGKGVDGNVVLLNKEVVAELIEETRAFVREIASKLKLPRK
jgi:hypothetical protein